MSEFMHINIGDIGKTITGKTPSSKHPTDFGDKYMFVTPSDNLNCKYIESTNRYLSKIGYQKLKTKSLPPSSILVSCIGSAMGKIVMNRKDCVTNQQFNSIIPNEEFSADYIYYNLKNNYSLLRNSAQGSTAVPLLNKANFDELVIAIHSSKNTQQKIASILSSLDDKIELNNQINDNLPN